MRFGIFDHLEQPGDVPWHELYRHRLDLLVRAEELCMLDQLSEGRLEIGFGKGISVREHCEQFAEEAGTDYFVGVVAWGDLSAYEVDRSFDLFAEHVMAPLAAS